MVIIIIIFGIDRTISSAFFSPISHCACVHECVTDWNIGHDFLLFFSMKSVKKISVIIRIAFIVGHIKLMNLVIWKKM